MRGHFLRNNSASDIEKQDFVQFFVVVVVGKPEPEPQQIIMVPQHCCLETDLD